MTATLPMFPLELVVYPGERLALHIFEERYQQLIKDCEEEALTFGIPSYINNAMSYGTEVALVQVVKRYDSGASDIICKGQRIFRMTAFYSNLENKQYAGAQIEYQEDIPDGTEQLKNEFLNLLQGFYRELQVEFPTSSAADINTFTFAHKMGLSIEQELELLQMESEASRYLFLIDNLQRVLPTIKAVNRTKALIKLNGHFKNFDPLDFKKFKL